MANKTDSGNGSKAICRVSNVLRSPSSDPSRSIKKSIMRIVRHIVGGLISALIIGVLAMLFAGAGHGWNCSVYSFFPSLLGAPLATAAWAAERNTVRILCASISLLIGLGSDFYLALMTAEEGVAYLGKVLDAMPLLFIVWLLLFGGWQVIAASAIMKSKKQI